VNWNLNNIKPTAEAFDIKVWTEKGDFQKGARDISIVPKARSYRIGDKINLYFRSEKDCYLTLLNYGTSGNMTVLLPNGISQDHFIKAGRTYAIPGEEYPFDYILSGPTGTEKIKAIGTNQKINLMDMKFNKDELFNKSSSVAKDIKIIEDHNQKLAKGEGRVVISASKPDQLSYEDANLGHGVVTYHLIDALSGKADTENRRPRVTVHSLVIMGSKDPDFKDPKSELNGWLKA
jgi:hypothetical protein